MSYELAKIMTDAPVKLEDLPDLQIDWARIVAALEVGVQVVSEEVWTVETGRGTSKRKNWLRIQRRRRWR